ncbi:hypothetical protein KSP39_PZI014010 [Platanthera zijinensis]|uniref:Lactate/malate dehydrogenase C-terminal domain-containing protein n=1 Tax=Platanthera zijinensis TaxID=2320716 RepID=A0AAP0BF26_9ASPA
MHSPRKPHWDAAIRVLHYLKGCPGKGILYSKTGHLRVEAWTDTDYAGSVYDRRSTSGYCMFLGGNLVTWRSKKKSVVSRSSAEAEYKAMALGICELLWLRILLTNLKIPIENPMILYCDNKSAISIVRLGKNGVEEVLGLGSLSDFEKEGLENLKTELKDSIKKGIKFTVEN